jgi:predicted dehydrogenase
MASDAIRAGKDVFVEKPMALRRDEATMLASSQRVIDASCW